MASSVVVLLLLLGLPSLAAAQAWITGVVRDESGAVLPGVSVEVGLVSPFSMYGERSNQGDLRFGKTIRIDRARATLNFDMFNAFNASPVLAQNNNFGAWQRPTVILAGRLFKVGVQFDF